MSIEDQAPGMRWWPPRGNLIGYEPIEKPWSAGRCDWALVTLRSCLNERIPDRAPFRRVDRETTPGGVGRSALWSMSRYAFVHADGTQRLIGGLPYPPPERWGLAEFVPTHIRVRLFRRVETIDAEGKRCVEYHEVPGEEQQIPRRQT